MVDREIRIDSHFYHKTLTMKPEIIIVGGFQFPEGCAAALRVLGIGKALREAGYRVLFAGVQRSSRPEDRQADGFCIYQGFPYFTREYGGKSSFDRWKWFFQAYVNGATTFERLSKLDMSAAKAIIAYHPSSMFLSRLMSYCRERRIALIADTTEWFPAVQLPGKWFSPFYWDQEYRLRRLQPKCGNIIAISSYLEEYYLSRKCSTILVPTLLDYAHAEPMSAFEENRIREGELRLVFSGANGREKWDAIFEAMTRLNASGCRVRLDVYGNKKEYFYSWIVPRARELADRLGDAITFHGRLPREEYLRGVANADFLIMLRNIEKWSEACFPTKFPEVMLQGVPLISNSHSDICKYAREGQEMLLVEKPSADELTRTLKRALGLPRSEILRMKEQARKRVAECFDYRAYAGPLRDFVEGAVRKAKNALN
jgi:glycosyltransferase involved in cell wall biosynthesis